MCIYIYICMYIYIYIARKISKKDIQNIKSSTKMLVFAGKSRNLYDLSRDHYEKSLHDNITQTYKKAGPQAKKNIDNGIKKICKIT